MTETKTDRSFELAKRIMKFVNETAVPGEDKLEALRIAEIICVGEDPSLEASE